MAARNARINKKEKELKNIERVIEFMQLLKLFKEKTKKGNS